MFLAYWRWIIDLDILVQLIRGDIVYAYSHIYRLRSSHIFRLTEFTLKVTHF